MRRHALPVGIILGTIVLLVGGIVLASRTQPQVLSANSKVEVETPQMNYDWGTISMQVGKVEARFPIQNKGTQPLILSRVQTSCMCTTATLLFQGKTSPPFGMHAPSAYTLTIPSGEQAELVVVFDPAFHGPSGVGSIDRQVTMKTNDAIKPELTFFMTATVTP